MAVTDTAAVTDTVVVSDTAAGTTKSGHLLRQYLLPERP